MYWLCVSRFPNTFRPEILGLNLAMELSGVGGGYRRTSLALKKYGFTTLFVDLHNTIDNVSTGHSAWAAELHVIVQRGGAEWTSPDDRLDAILDFLAHAAADIPRLVAEVRRLRNDR